MSKNKNGMALWITDGGIKPKQDSAKIAVYPKTPTEVAEILNNFHGCVKLSAVRFTPGAGLMAKAWGFKSTLLNFAWIEDKALVLIVDRETDTELDESSRESMLSAYNFKVAMVV